MVKVARHSYHKNSTQESRAKPVSKTGWPFLRAGRGNWLTKWKNIIFFCAGVVYSGEYDVCDATLSVYPHRTSLKNMPGHGGNRTYDLWNLRLRPDRVAQLAEHWASIPKVIGSIPTVAGHIFQARPVWIYTERILLALTKIRAYGSKALQW